MTRKNPWKTEPDLKALIQAAESGALGVKRPELIRIGIASSDPETPKHSLGPITPCASAKDELTTLSTEWNRLLKENIAGGQTPVLIIPEPSTDTQRMVNDDLVIQALGMHQDVLVGPGAGVHVETVNGGATPITGNQFRARNSGFGNDERVLYVEAQDGKGFESELIRRNAKSWTGHAIVTPKDVQGLSDGARSKLWRFASRSGEDTMIELPKVGPSDLAGHLGDMDIDPALLAFGHKLRDKHEMAWGQRGQEQAASAVLRWVLEVGLNTHRSAKLAIPVPPLVLWGTYGVGKSEMLNAGMALLDQLWKLRGVSTSTYSKPKFETMEHFNSFIQGEQRLKYQGALFVDENVNVPVDMESIGRAIRTGWTFCGATNAPHKGRSLEVVAGLPVRIVEVPGKDYNR